MIHLKIKLTFTFGILILVSLSIYLSVFYKVRTYQCSNDLIQLKKYSKYLSNIQVNEIYFYKEKKLFSTYFEIYGKFSNPDQQLSNLKDNFSYRKFIDEPMEIVNRNNLDHNILTSLGFEIHSNKIYFPNYDYLIFLAQTSLFNMDLRVDPISGIFILLLVEPGRLK